MAGRSVCSGSRSQVSNLSLLLHNHAAASCASEPEHVDTLFLSCPSSSFLGSRSMMNFGDAQMKRACCESFFRPFAHDDNRDDDFDEYFHQPEKKKRLTTDQVLFLEKSFEVENKLEPERKIQLAKDLGLQPRQVAIWFQNRRARWKTKQLEKDYEVLHASFNSLKADYENLLKEKDKLNAEILEMTDKLLKRKREIEKVQLLDTEGPQGPALKDLVDTISEGEGFKVSAMACKKEDLSSAKSDIFDSGSPHCTDGVHSSLLEPCRSPHVLEASDLSQDEEDNVSKDLFSIPTYVFPKFEDVDYSNPPESSCNFGFLVEDHAFWSWSF